MKKLILIAASLFTVNTVLNAQDINAKAKAPRETKQKQPIEKRAQRNVDHLNSMVVLTEDQKQKVLVLSIEKIKKADEIRERFKNDPEKHNKMYPEMQVVKENYRNSVRSLLTPEQLEKLKLKHKELQGAGKPTELDKE